MALRNITINRSEVRALLNSPEMQQVVRRASEEIAGRVRAAGSPLYPSLAVSVTVETNAGAKGDRAQGHVIVAAPAPGEVRFPDVEGRFGVLARVARDISA